jgi:hypothetical protein
MRMALQIAVIGAVGALVLGTVAAQASDATLLAGRAGFLVGHAHRCGVAQDRLERSAALIKEVISAFSLDDDDRKAGQERFDERVLAGALADLLDDLVPSCGAVRAQLALLEKHRRAVPLRPGTQHPAQMARANRSDGAPALAISSPRAQPAKSAKPASTRREDLTPERRAGLELRRAAQQVRGKLPAQ